MNEVLYQPPIEDVKLPDMESRTSDGCPNDEACMLKNEFLNSDEFMTAEEAFELSYTSTDKSSIIKADKYSIIFGKIRTAAEAGKYNIEVKAKFYDENFAIIRILAYDKPFIRFMQDNGYYIYSSLNYFGRIKDEEPEEYYATIQWN